MSPKKSNTKSTVPSSTPPLSGFPVIHIQLGGRRGPSDEGKLLQLPEDYNPADVEIHSPESLRATGRTMKALREEEERAREAGMTVDELRHYQDLLTKTF